MLQGEEETETAETGERERLQIRERTPRIVRLQCDVQLAEDYYLSKWQRGKNTEEQRKREREREREDNKERKDTEEGGGEGNVTSSIMVQLLLCTTYSR